MQTATDGMTNGAGGGMAGADMPRPPHMAGVGGGDRVPGMVGAEPVPVLPTAPHGATPPQATEPTAAHIADLIAKAEEAFAGAWMRGAHGPGAMALSNDSKRTRIIWRQWLKQTPPRPDEAAAVLRDAIARWGSVPQASLHPMDQMAAHAVPVHLPPVPVPAGQIIAKLAAKGITLAVNETGGIVATPGGMLSDAERTMVRQQRESLRQALQSSEVI